MVELEALVQSEARVEHERGDHRAGAVARRAQPLGERRRPRRRGGTCRSRARRGGSGRARSRATSGRQRSRRRRGRVREQDAVAGERVEHGRGDALVAVGVEMVGARRVGGDDTRFQSRSAPGAASTRSAGTRSSSTRPVMPTRLGSCASRRSGIGASPTTSSANPRASSARSGQRRARRGCVPEVSSIAPLACHRAGPPSYPPRRSGINAPRRHRRTPPPAGTRSGRGSLGADARLATRPDAAGEPHDWQAIAIRPRPISAALAGSGTCSMPRDPVWILVGKERASGEAGQVEYDGVR